MNTNNKVWELCPHCEEEVELDAVKCKLQRCPNCGRMIKPCSMCDMDKCDCSRCDKRYNGK